MLLENSAKIKALTLIAVLAVGLGALSYFMFFQTAADSAEPERFVIALNPSEPVAASLKKEGFIKNTFAFRLAYNFRGQSRPGAYKISKSMSLWQIAGVLAKDPYMEWVTIPEGLRKEQTAEILAQALKWPREEKEKWLSLYTTGRAGYVEGVYFPDTYLIPTDEKPADTAKRLQARFEEKFAPLAKEAIAQNIRWVTAVKLASLVQREAAGKEDMPLVAGILWNRLLKDMRLEVDATLQYVRDSELIKNDPEAEIKWWTPIKVADKQIDSPYNTYQNSGLPPQPIASPGLDALRAVLYPAVTDCLYYLHDDSGEIHCSDTYEGHKKNIEQYL